MGHHNGHRVIRAPWEEADPQSRIRVGREGYGSPDPGAWARYQARWPSRYWKWNTALQCIEVRWRNPTSGEDERVSLVREAIATPDGGQLFVPVPLDHRWVVARYKDADQQWNNSTKKWLLKIAAREDALRKSKLATANDHINYGWGRDLKRYWGQIRATIDGKSRTEARTERQPLFVVPQSLPTTAR
jgi:hypothetical protein